MRKDDVPQDDSFYAGNRRACYAVDSEGRYGVAHSAGWSVERDATEQALLALEAQVECVRQDVLAGNSSSLAYHMHARQMVPSLLAAHVGIATWRVKRHLKPRVFAKLNADLLQRYCECLDLTVEQLAKVPETAEHIFLTDSSE